MSKYRWTKSYARMTDTQALPALIEVQLDSFERFQRDGVLNLLDEVSPIESFNKKLQLFFPGTARRRESWG